MSSLPRILVVEDNLPVRSLLRRTLEQLGCRVDAEPNGRSALKTARRNPPDLIFMDMRLPGLDGPDLLVKLRRTRGLDRVPVVGMSGYAFPQLKSEALARGCCIFLEKPLALAEVRAAVAQVLGHPCPAESGDTGH